MFLEEHSKRMREALIALGEDEEEPTDEAAEADAAKSLEDAKFSNNNSNPLPKEDTDMISAATEYIQSKRGTAMEDID
tara:strand:+ start:329 stop:562 length:234 start_codon:yes stop_codon:yes gene_type:complete